MTNLCVFALEDKFPGILSSSALAPEFCHFCLDFNTMSLPPNFCYNVHLWMNYGYALFHNLWKPLSWVFGRGCHGCTKRVVCTKYIPK